MEKIGHENEGDMEYTKPIDYFTNNEVNLTRIAKEFIKFNERCFIQLLGDMRSYNYVIFDTRNILGVDLKFIVRINKE